MIVQRFVLPLGFAILDVDEDVETTLILRRPFLNTFGVIINWRDGKITLKI